MFGGDECRPATARECECGCDVGVGEMGVYERGTYSVRCASQCAYGTAESVVWSKGCGDGGNSGESAGIDQWPWRCEYYDAPPRYARSGNIEDVAGDSTEVTDRRHPKCDRIGSAGEVTCRHVIHGSLCAAVSRRS